MRYVINSGSFYEVPLTSSTVQNTGNVPIEISDTETFRSGIVLNPGEKFSWDNATLYARVTYFDKDGVLAVVPFKKGGKGGGGTPKVEPLAAPKWASDTTYSINALVEHNNTLYMCKTAHTSTNDFDTDYDSGYWTQINKPVAGGNGYIQYVKLDSQGTTSIPEEIVLPINYTTLFCLPPIEVLKIVPGPTGVLVNVYAMNSTDATDFNYDADKVEFDGTMHMKTSFALSMSTPTALENGYASESEEIDPAEWASIEAVTVE